MNRSRDRGDSLVEILVALAVLAIGITGLLGALADHAATTTINRDQSQVETALLSAAEYVKSLPFAQCTPAGWTTVTQAAVPHDPAYTLEYGNAHPLGTVSCSDLAVVQLRATGNGFQNVVLDVVKRP